MSKNKKTNTLILLSGGIPLTQADYKKDIDEAILQAQNSQAVSQEDLEKQL